jgi:hypothetical protein
MIFLKPEFNNVLAWGNNSWFKKNWLWLLVYIFVLIPIFFIGVPITACYQFDNFMNISATLFAILWLSILLAILVTAPFIAIFPPFRLLFMKGIKRLIQSMINWRQNQLLKLIQQHMQLLNLLKYSLIFSFLLIYLPLTACPDFQLHSILGGLFIELDSQIIFVVSMAMFGAIWALAFTQGLTVDSLEPMFSNSAQDQPARNDTNKEKNYINWAYKFFNSNITPGQFSVYFLVILIGIGIIILHTKEGLITATNDTPKEDIIILNHTLAGLFLGLRRAILGLIFGYVLVDAFTNLLSFRRRRYFDFKPLPFSIFKFGLRMLRKLFYRISQRNQGKTAERFLKNVLVSTEQKIPPSGRPANYFTLAPGHRLALIVSLIMASCPFIFGWLLPQLFATLSSLTLSIPEPSNWSIFSELYIYFLAIILALEPTSWPALPHLYVLIIILIFLFSGLDYWLREFFRLPFLLILILAIFWGYNTLNIDHYYYIHQISTPEPVTLTPINVAKASKALDNLVVVTSTGGGIWAAGWTTKALKELINARPELLQEIRLLSTVSGGSVGAAYFVHDLCRTQKDMSESSIARAGYLNKARTRAEFLNETQAKAVASSVSAVAYGFAYFDSLRLLTAGLLSPFIETDRAKLQEDRWASIASAGPVDPNTLDNCDTMIGLRQSILAGRLPAPIFNATALESGRRIMITPINFELTAVNSARHAEETRADTLSELLFKPTGSTPNQPLKNYEADLSLWTAARLSAAFPYVTPAARARLAPNSNADRFAEDDPNYQGRKYHLIDGGYYDNFGVTSALDWLQMVLEDRSNPPSNTTRAKRLTFSKVAIIEIRAFPLQTRTCYQAEQGASAALLGPMVGLYNIRTGSAYSRNEIELTRFIDTWNKRLRPLRVKIERFIFEPHLETLPNGCKKEQEIGPLSWHLTQADIGRLDSEWARTITGDNEDELSRLKNFLAP